MTISAKVIADSISKEKVRITTLQLKFHRYILPEFNTHRQFSRNASSSRAIPVEKLIEIVKNDPAIPIHWGKNQPGMQAREENNNLIVIDENLSTTNEKAWLIARDNAVDMAYKFNKADYHKQIVNRLLEPFMWTNVLVTATEWSNFFALRLHPDAQPEIHELARVMKEALDNSKPNVLNVDEWHLPYVNDLSESKEIKIKCSVARCARVSYLTHDFKKPSVDEDLKLYERLLGNQPVHASPAEHQATPDYLIDTSDWYDRSSAWKNKKQWGNFRGWIQYRKTLKNECL